jgi:hypothetical protein
MDNQNILRIVLCCAIIAALFLPLYNESVFGATVSALQILTGGFKDVNGDQSLPASQMVLISCLLVVMVCVIIIFVFSIVRKVTPVWLNLLPLLAIIGLIIFSMTQSNENVGTTLQAFGTGFYVMFLGSFLMPFTSIAVPTTTNS